MSTIAKINLDEYDQMIRSGVFDGPNQRRIELIYGELRDMSPISEFHEVLVDVLTEWSFETLPEKSAWIRVQNSVGIPELDSAPEPDIGWMARRDYTLQRPRPDDVLLIIEVANSSLRFDRGEKADLYATAGIKDYWIVNIPQRLVEVHRKPRDGRYCEIDSVGSGAVQPLAFPDIELDAETLFARLPVHD